jgi:hypothetical protein
LPLCLHIDYIGNIVKKDIIIIHYKLMFKT